MATKKPTADDHVVSAAIDESLAAIQEAEAFIDEAGHSPEDNQVKPPASGEQTSDGQPASQPESSASIENAQSTSDDGMAKTPVTNKEDKEARAALKRLIAKRQRKEGAKELERLYPGVVIAPVHIELHDFNIASSAQRFLGLADKTLHLLNRVGERIMSYAEVEKARLAIFEKINDYVREAKEADEQGKLLVKNEQAKEHDMWLEPQYSSATMVTDFGVKVREVVPLIKALKLWDQSLLHFATLDFNGAGDADQIDTLRRRERHLFTQINVACLRTIRGLGRRGRMVKKAYDESASGEGASKEPASSQGENNPTQPA